MSEESILESWNNRRHILRGHCEDCGKEMDTVLEREVGICEECGEKET